MTRSPPPTLISCVRACQAVLATLGLLLSLACQHAQTREHLSSTPQTLKQSEGISLVAAFELEGGAQGEAKFYELYLKKTSAPSPLRSGYRLVFARIDAIPATSCPSLRSALENFLRAELARAPLYFRPKKAVFISLGSPTRVDYNPIGVMEAKAKPFEALNAALLEFLKTATSEEAGSPGAIGKLATEFEPRHFVPILWLADSSQVLSMGLAGPQARVKREMLLSEINSQIAASPSKYGLKIVVEPCPQNAANGASKV